MNSETEVKQPRSVFSNYAAGTRNSEEATAGAVTKTADDRDEPAWSPDEIAAHLDVAFARAFAFRVLARAYQYPDAEGWAWLSDRPNQAAFCAAVRALVGNAGELVPEAELLVGEWGGENYERFVQQYVEAFGHAARGSCPLNEIEYGDLKADPLFQPHRLADLVAFYRAFGLSIAEDASERQDHICFELEFMSVLAAKEAHALKEGMTGEPLWVIRDAQRKFLQEHLGRWTVAFSRRLARACGAGPLFALAEFTRAFVTSECGRFGVAPGGDELSLRSVDPAAESLCSTCGLAEQRE